MKPLPAATALLTLALATPSAAEEVRESHYVMGTLLEIAVEAPDRATGQRWIRQAVGVARNLDRQFTNYDQTSALMDLNRQAGRGPQTVGPHLYSILELSARLSAESQGAFDVSVGALLALHKAARAEGREPTKEEVRRTLDATSYRRIRFQPPARVELATASMELDLGAIGKGYAAERMAALLRSLGVGRALISFGRSTYVAIGPPAGQQPWQIWIERRDGLAGPVMLRDKALSSSSSSKKGEDETVRAAPHIIDPRSGLWIETDRDVTVICNDASVAEAWSTALVVAPGPLLPLLEERTDLAAVVFEAGRARATPSFEPLAGWRAAP